jgi:hypothetical protein
MKGSTSKLGFGKNRPAAGRHGPNGGATEEPAVVSNGKARPGTQRSSGSLTHRRVEQIWQGEGAPSVDGALPRH